LQTSAQVRQSQSLESFPCNARRGILADSCGGRRRHGRIETTYTVFQDVAWLQQRQANWRISANCHDLLRSITLHPAQNSVDFVKSHPRFAVSSLFALECALPRAYWNGFLKLSFVSCPVALYPARQPRNGCRSGRSTAAQGIASSTSSSIPLPAKPWKPTTT
jgi:hypothetical protein